MAKTMKIDWGSPDLHWQLVTVGISVCLLMLTGCAMSPIPLGLPCTVGPVILDKADVLTRSTAEQIVTLNNSGRTLCHWVPPKKK